MNNNFFFYVCDDEYDKFKGGDEENIYEFISHENVRYKYREEFDEDNQRNVYVIVVDGASMVSKNNAHENYKLTPNDLAGFIAKYFEELNEIAQAVFEEMGEEWSPESVTVLTHWGGEPVDDKERAFSNAVKTFAESHQFRKWKTVSSSSTRQEAFPVGFNPFAATPDGTQVDIPSLAICKELEEKLPLAGEIEWEKLDYATIEDMELKKMYDMLMLKLNH